MIKDAYLRKFVNYCRKKFNNLIAIVIYGSYVWGYFDKKKSDYDIIVIFKDKVPRGKSKIKRKFKKIRLPYFYNTDYFIKRNGLEHWASYITLTKVGRVLYKTKDYNSFLKILKKREIIKKTNISTLKRKIEYEKNALKRVSNFKALKWAFSSIRKRLSLLSYVKYKKMLWEFKKILFINKSFLTKEEVAFLKELEKKLRKRTSKFSKKEKKISLRILEKIDEEVLSKLSKQKPL